LFAAVPAPRATLFCFLGSVHDVQEKPFDVVDEDEDDDADCCAACLCFKVVMVD
jgi:hypothetical protein